MKTKKEKTLEGMIPKGLRKTICFLITLILCGLLTYQGSLSGAQMRDVVIGIFSIYAAANAGEHYIERPKTEDARADG